MQLLKWILIQKLEIVPLVATGIVKINGIDPRTYIKKDNNSYWVIGSDRRSSWAVEGS